MKPGRPVGASGRDALLGEVACTGYDFSDALRLLKAGRKMARSGWNGRGMWIVFQKAYPDGIPINSNTAEAIGAPQGTVCVFRPYLMMKAADHSFVPWVASQTDILANDWTIADDAGREAEREGVRVR